MNDSEKSEVSQRPISLPVPAEPPQAQRPTSAPEPAPPAPVPEAPKEEDRGPGPRMRDLDKDIQSELDAVLGGLSDKEIYGEPARRQPRPPPGTDTSRKKGKVLAVHGGDVFVDVPGGRSQGMLPRGQFPEGPPAV